MRDRHYHLVIFSLAVIIFSQAQVGIAFNNNLALVAPSCLSVREEKKDKKIYAVGKILIRAKPERVWQILSDYGNASNIFQTVTKVKILNDDGAKKLVRETVHLSGVPMNFDYVLEVKEKAPYFMEWHRKSGALKEIDGSWKLESDSMNRGTIATYSIYVDGGMFLPNWLMRGQSKKYLPNVLESVRNAAEKMSAEASETGTDES